METQKVVRAAWITAAVFMVAGAVGAVVVRDQISRHRRNLFSPTALRRLAALGYLTNKPASVDAVLLLRDYIAWEQRPFLKRRAVAALERMEEALVDQPGQPLPAGGL